MTAPIGPTLATMLADAYTHLRTPQKTLEQIPEQYRHHAYRHIMHSILWSHSLCDPVRLLVPPESPMKG